MKYIISIILTTILLSFGASCNKLKISNNQQTVASNKNDNNEIPVDSMIQNLPKAAQDYIAEFLSGKEVARVSASEGDYVVWLKSGEKLDFNLQGKIKKIEAPGGIPDSVIDNRIIQDVKTMNPKIFIIKMEQNGFGYVVKLSNGNEVKYDPNCQRLETEYD